MHTEHKTLKWCIALLALIISIAVISAVAFQTVPAGAPVTAEIETQTLAKETAAVKQMPEEMASLSDAESMDADKTAGSEEQIETEPQNSAAPVKVTITVDGNEMKLMAAPVTVKKVLELYGIPVGKDDLVEPAMDQQLTEDTEIAVKRIVFEEVVESEPIPFKTKVKGTDKLPAGTKKVVQKGQKGEAEVTYKITYSDGKEVSRKEVSRKTVKKPVTKIIEKSTVGTIQGKEYTKKFTVKAYSYTGGGRTASGLPAAEGRIAVDPSVIPLGTRVYVEGYGFAVAADTGGNIKGNTIDVYYNARSSCIRWGCRHVTIYILK